jgi:hypothetical protein
MFILLVHNSLRFVADELGRGSTQATEDPSSAGKDGAFWDALNTHVKNLHAVISGHGKFLAKPFCSRLRWGIPPDNLGPQIMGMNGVPVNLQRTSCFALINTQGASVGSDSSNGAHLTYCPLFRYGGYTGAGWGQGVRNIVFSSADPAIGLETWIRLEDGQTRAKVMLDGTYGR